MTDIAVELSQETLDALRRRAERNGRSVEEEAFEIVEEAMREELGRGSEELAARPREPRTSARPGTSTPHDDQPQHG